MSVFSRASLPAPGTVLGVIAILISLSGSAYAIDLAKNSVTSRVIKNGQVKGIDIQNNGVTGTDVAESSFAAVPLAQSATKANSADSAAGAQSVNGHSATCPGGTTLVGGLCFESSLNAAANYVTAVTGCRDKGAFLPGASELFTALPTLGNIAAGGEWTSVRYFDDSGMGAAATALSLNSTGAFGPASTTGASLAYRCIFPLVR